MKNASPLSFSRSSTTVPEYSSVNVLLTEEAALTSSSVAFSAVAASILGKRPQKAIRGFRILEQI
jgi:hypothetical protein